MAAHRKLWHKGLQRCALLTRKLGLDLMESNQPSTRGHEIRDSSLISTSVRMVHLQRTSDEKRPGRGRQRINPREFATTGPRTPETAAKYLLHPGLRQDGGGDQRGVSEIRFRSQALRLAESDDEATHLGDHRNQANGQREQRGGEVSCQEERGRRSMIHWASFPGK